MQKDRLTEYLKAHHLGAEHAVTSRVLETLFDLKGKQLRDIVNALRREGVPIASDGSGYFYAKTEQEIRTTILHMKRRISGISAAIAGLNRSLGRFDKMQTRLPLEGGDEH